MALLEVVIAVILFTIIAVPMAVHMTNSLKMERQAAIHTLAVLTAQTEMERVYGLSTSEIDGFIYDDPWFSGSFTAIPYIEWGLHDVRITITSKDFPKTVVAEQRLILPMP